MIELASFLADKQTYENSGGAGVGLVLFILVLFFVLGGGSK